MEKVRILFIQNSLVCGGAEQALYDLVTLMDREKFDITILAQYQGGEWYQKFCDTGIRVITPWSCQKYSANPFRKLWNKYIGLWIVSSFRHEGEKLVPRCTFEKFDIIVSYSIWTLQKCGFATGSKSVKIIHGDIATNDNYRASILNYLDVMERYDRVICVSQAAKESFCRMTGIEKNVVMHYNPLNSSRVREMALELVDNYPSGKIVCAVGRLGEEKGFSRLIRIHKELLEQGAFHNLVIVGDGPERQKLETQIRKLGVETSVFLVGYTANPYPYMKMADMLVCSSFTEGLPVVSMEALCLGIPVVSAVPSIGEIFSGDVCGVITENDDESLRQGLFKMLTDSEFYASARAGAERQSRKLEGTKMVREMEKEFLSLLENKED